MTTYVLIPGAGGSPWYWPRLVPELQQRGHDVVAVNLPAADDSAGLAEYAQAVIDAAGDRTRLILVAQSLAGLTAPLVCVRLPVDLLVLLNAMVPVPGECAGRWWANTGHA
jgi:pimeloyl-ACP methyl ester carboxylesterase